MNFTEPFSVLNEKLKPRYTVSEQLYSSLTRLEDRQLGSLRNRSSTLPRPTFLSREPEPESLVSTTEPEDPEESENDAEQEDLFSDGLEEGNNADPMCVLPVLNLKDVGLAELVEEEDKSDETDGPQNLTSGETEEGSEPVDSASEGESPFVRQYIDRTLPDLIRSDRPLSRRRTLGHVSDTLKEVRREVELSRKRSIKLKAQVDRLQESRVGPEWSQHRERVTEEVLSVLGLLGPLTGSGPPQLSQGPNCLDSALSQLQLVARKLAINRTNRDCKSGSEDSAILQQALRDRDEAIEKKKAMEEELLRSKTEMMLLNNQLLEAVQKRLELTLELDAWKEDIQVVIRQQVHMQQQAEQAQKKTTLMGMLRKNYKPSTQRPPAPPTSTIPTHASPTTNTNQIFIPRADASAPPTPRMAPANINRTWRDRLRRGKNSRHGDLESVVQDLQHRDDDGFQVVSLD